MTVSPLPAMSPPAISLGAALSPREREVLDLVSSGLTNGQVARRLSISPRTVHKHLEHVYAKLGVTNRVAAAMRHVAAAPARPSAA
jgi:DNA-binding CsgD family transcriptional regulator